LRGLLNGLLRVGNLDLPGHHFAYLHGCLRMPIDPQVRL
jgi:hypothetical protein